ncbi:gamma-glutamylcyclotransferase [Aliishimia ponticola]|uniref:Gamma-glutamylcyclotransferase n=1 Tax=Aliishimia ponticola TaxID=2499833 RepID=A0A4S4N7S5_9RHOB|nr:gamma-glutamylcyclotransferase [Aliishimia ponticola]THH35224.1 gamma-glutamylcyclotransferase [Aliishimia ponticola]
MSTPCFFGYGSLVNLDTHDYPDASPATARGWRRAWVHTDARQFAFLTASRAPGHSIDGMIARVPAGDWAELDLREMAYDRILDTANITHTRTDGPEIAIYAIESQSKGPATQEHPILLSYVDVVVQGYLRAFGETGAIAFMDSTDGWTAPILDDRAAPIYPRSQKLTLDEMLLVDDYLAGVGAMRQTL